jgi:hypothetical protein
VEGKNMNQPKYFLLLRDVFLAVLIICTFLFILACEEKLEKPDNTLIFAEKLTCEGCHTDQVTLQELAPGIDEPPPSSGGG